MNWRTEELAEGQVYEDQIRSDHRRVLIHSVKRGRVFFNRVDANGDSPMIGGGQACIDQFCLMLLASQARLVPTEELERDYTAVQA